MREAPARALIDLLLKAGARVRAYDPVAAAEAQRIYGEHGRLRTGAQRLRGGAGCGCARHRHRVAGVPQPRFRAPASELLKSPLIFDGRNLYDPAHGGAASASPTTPSAAASRCSRHEVAHAMLIPVILSGGAGTRLWPLSRELYPKQLLPLTGERTMLQQTALRLDGLAAAAPGRGVQRGASLPGGRAAAPAADRAARHDPRAVRAQHRARHRAGGARRAQGARRRRQRGRPGAAGPAGRSRHPRRAGLPAGGARGAAGGRSRAAGDLRHRGDAARRPATATSSVGAAARRRLPHRALRREAQCRARARVPGLRGLLLEQRHVHVPRAPLSAGAAALRARDRARVRRPPSRAAQSGPGLHAHRRRRASRPAPRLHRLRGHGEDRATRWSCRSMPAGATSAPGPRCTRRATATRTATWRAAMSSCEDTHGCYLYSESRLVAAVGLRRPRRRRDQGCGAGRAQGSRPGRARSWCRG